MSPSFFPQTWHLHYQRTGSGGVRMAVSRFFWFLNEDQAWCCSPIGTIAVCPNQYRILHWNMASLSKMSEVAARLSWRVEELGLYRAWVLTSSRQTMKISPARTRPLRMTMTAVLLFANRPNRSRSLLEPAPVVDTTSLDVILETVFSGTNSDVSATGYSDVITKQTAETLLLVRLKLESTDGIVVETLQRFLLWSNCKHLHTTM